MLETERLLLRRPCKADLVTWETYFYSQRATPHGGGPGAVKGLAWRVFASFLGHWELNRCGPFAIVSKGENKLIGLAGPWYPSNWPEKELTWSIWRPDCEGRGYAHEAAASVRSHVFHELAWETAVSYIDGSNTRSIALAERLGCIRDPSAETPNGDEVFVYRHKV